MPSPHLPNYLRTHRKHSGLSQVEVAFLLGSKNGARVCRHERRAQTPNLRTLIAYELLFGTPIRELYGGVRGEVQRRLTKRARLLLQKLLRRESGQRTTRKIQTLYALLERWAGR